MTVLQNTFRDQALAWRARLHWLLTEQSPEGMLRRGFALLLVITLVTAYFSETFFFPDEHYQILEYMSLKLGVTSAADLPWEFRAQARPWLQPFLYFLIAKPLIAVGIGDLFNVVFVLRLATASVGLWALWVFAKFLIDDFDREDEKRAYARMLPFMGFLPYLFVRTSSETLAAAFFTLGLVFAVQAARSPSLRRIALAGLFCGLAFECRYQAAFLVLGLFLWLVFIARARKPLLAGFIGGGIVPVAAALLIDRWGYGVWSFPPWNYIDVNLVQGVSSKVFGSSPFYAYLYLEAGTIFGPIAMVLVAAMIIACMRNPKHYASWVTAPFFIVHCLMAHKEERFLFPLAILATAYPVLAFSPARERLFAGFGRLWNWRRSIAAKAIGWGAVAAMLFLAVYPFGIRPHMKMAKYLYRHFPAGLTAYSFDAERFDSYPMYRPNPYRVDILFDRQNLAAALAKGPVYLFSDTPTLPPAAQGVHAQLVYSEFLFAQSPEAAARATKIMCGYAALKRSTPIHPPRLAFWTLFLLEPGGSDQASSSPCTPDWTSRR